MRKLIPREAVTIATIRYLSRIQAFCVRRKMSTTSKTGISTKPLSSDNNRMLRIAITGGPCGGKTTAIEQLSKELQNQGFDVYTLPEMATLLFNAGARIGGMNEMKVMAFQAAILRNQINLEDSFSDLARAQGRKVVILCDRGACDGRAYMTEVLWNKLLDLNAVTTESLFNRYDLVLHLVTSANGASEFYTLANNEARSETKEEAILVDERTQKAWHGHPRHYIIDNSTDFQGKMDRLHRKLEGAVKALL